MKNNFVYSGFTILVFFALSCAQESIPEERLVTEKAPFDDICSAMEGPWGISDGIKVVREGITEFFCFEIEGPPTIIRNKADINFFYRMDSLGITIHHNQLTYTIDSLYPFYALNSLSVFKANDKSGAYFYTSLLSFPYGFDPYEKVMWVFYNQKLFKFSEIIPTYPHNDWDDTFSCTPDLNLKNECYEAFNIVFDIWKENIEITKQQFMKQQLQNSIFEN